MRKQFDRTLVEKIAKLIYECCRIEAEIMERRIVPEEWSKRDSAFREQFVEHVAQYLTSPEKPLPTPKAAHDSWMESYKAMGWKYGPIRDPEAKTHPDMVPYEELPQDERDKDEIFLIFVETGRRILDVLMREDPMLKQRLMPV